MDRIDIVLKKMTEVDDDEWLVAMYKCREIINLRTKGKTLFGAHSEKRLGMEPFDYYFQAAIDKLYKGEWDWKFEKYSLAEQLTRIVGSMISEAVRKYRLEREKEQAGDETISLVSLDEVAFLVGVDFGDELESMAKEKIYEEQLSTIEQAIVGNDEMEYLYILISEGKDKSQICEETGWDKKKLYKLTEHMNKKVKNYITKHSQKVQK